MRAFLSGILVVILAAAGGGWWALGMLERWATTPHSVKGEARVELRPRMTLPQLSRSLVDATVTNDGNLFHWWIKFDGSYARFQAGTYVFTGNVSPVLIRDKMIRGEIHVPNVLQVTIPEGFTLRMLNERIATKGIGQVAELNILVRDRKFLKELGVESSSLEGYTYPATYNFEKLPTPREFYGRVVRRFFERLPADYVKLATQKGLTLNQAVTFASLIELETMQEAEKPIIAEVIWRRLKKGDTLGIDASVIYGIPNYKGDIKWEHLKDTKNVYNTRIHRGLPPTAIGAVSRSSLEAVLNPTDLGYYYYMLDADDRTRHVFSRTGAEHNIQVQKFLRAQKNENFKKL